MKLERTNVLVDMTQENVTLPRQWWKTFALALAQDVLDEVGATRCPSCQNLRPCTCSASRSDRTSYSADGAINGDVKTEAERIEVGDVFCRIDLICPPHLERGRHDVCIYSAKNHVAYYSDGRPWFIEREWCHLIRKAALWVGAPVRVKSTGKYGVVTGITAQGCYCVDETHPPAFWHVLVGHGPHDLASHPRHELEPLALKEKA